MVVLRPAGSLSFRSWSIPSTSSPVPASSMYPATKRPAGLNTNGRTRPNLAKMAARMGVSVEGLRQGFSQAQWEEIRQVIGAINIDGSLQLPHGLHGVLRRVYGRTPRRVRPRGRCWRGCPTMALTARLSWPAHPRGRLHTIITRICELICKYCSGSLYVLCI